jgi:multidrug efflux pump subunit AcrA (membrane-fusion protein)
VLLYSTSLADIQKNTLQVKVAIENPPPTIRPDMLVQATFLAPAPPKSSDPASLPLRLLVYRRLVDTGDGESRVWVADMAAGVARSKSVQLGAANGEFVEVIAGLTAADKLISGDRTGLSDGQRIRVIGEDTSQMAATASPSKSPHLQRLHAPQGK